MGRVFVIAIHISKRALFLLAVLVLALAVIALGRRFIAAPPSAAGGGWLDFNLFGAAGRRQPAHVTVSALALDEPVPEFTIYTPDGAEWTRESWDGHPFVLVFWAAWCAECADLLKTAAGVHNLRPEEAAALGEAKGAAAVRLAAVNVADSPAAAAAFASRHGLNMPLLRDPTGDAAIAFGVGMLPAVVMVDEYGLVRDRLFGVVPSAVYIARLQAVVPESAR